MLLSVFEKYFFLQSLGWGIANSLWQAALLWLVYQTASKADKKLSALFKHHFSLLLLFTSFIWFSITVIQNYLLIKDSGDDAGNLGWLYVSGNFAASLQYVSLAYLGLLLFHIFQFIKHLKGVHALKNSRFIKAPVDTRIFTEQTALHIGIHKKVSIWLSENIDVPSVTGFFKPVILLPVTALNNLTTAQAEAVILHELAHIKRNDYIVNLIQSFIELVMFFNPFARLLGAAVRKERENCCDDWVLNYQYNKHDYASALLVLEQNRLQSIKLVLAATNGKKDLLGRVKRLFVAAPQVNSNFFQRVKLATAAFTLLAAIFFALPVLSKKAITTQPIAVKVLNASPVLAALETNATNNYTDSKVLTIINDAPAKIIHPKKKLIAIDEPEVAAAADEVEYNRALVNEELLQSQKQLQDIAIQAADKSQETANEMIVKIEEEQSGVKDKNTYVLQLKNNNGNAEIIPLILLNKKMKTLTGKLKNISNNTISDSIKTTIKKRTTS